MRSRCRSLLMTTDAVGGVWTYSLTLARLLSSQGVSIALSVLGPRPNATQVQEATAIPNLTLHMCEEPLEWMDDPWEGVARSGEFLMALSRSFRPDVVHLNGYAHGVLDLGRPKLIVAHSCILSWWEAVKGTPVPRRYAQYRSAVALGLQAAQEVVAPTRAMLGAIQRHYGFNKGHVIANGVAAPVRVEAPKQSIVLGAGRLWDEAKNFETLAQAAASTDFPVYVAGPGRNALPNVVQLGYLDTSGMHLWFRRASIYANPARYEPFGLAALEAASHGAALVLGDIESLREVWGSAALYVHPNDPVALRRAINLLARNPLLRESMARRAERKSRRYSIAKQAKLYLSLYNRMLLQHERDPRRFQAVDAGTSPKGSHAHRPFLSLSAQRLEPRQRPLPEGDRD